MKLFAPAAARILAVILLFAACRKKAFDEYYGRPDNLANPIYQQLQSRGNFTLFLQMIDRAGYKSVLSQAGYWTLFAPNDDAVNAFLKEQHVSEVSKLDSATVSSIVEYALVYNAFKKDKLDDYQSNAGLLADVAFKRRTAYYDFVYTDTVNGVAAKVVANNRNSTASSVNYVSGDYNNKYLPYFLPGYMNSKKLDAYDYNYFYPNTTYTGFNVAGAAVVNSDIVAENGMVHEVNKVIQPLLSLDRYLASKPQYSEFKKILDRFMVAYSPNTDVTHLYQVLSGSADQVYTKYYNASLAFAPNNENFLKLQDNDGQSDGWTLFVPTNEVVKNYVQNVLLEYYPVKSIDQLPLGVITDFLNAHMWNTTVWPSKFKATVNTLNEEARFDAAVDISDKQVLSNGLFYGTTKVQEANVFHSVYGKAYLHPSYSLLTKALNLELKLSVTNPNLRYLLFLVSDQALKQAGYDWNDANSTFQYTPAGGTVTIGGDAVTRLKRILSTHIVPLAYNETVDLSGEGILETYDGEYIRYQNNRIFSAGTQDNSNVQAQTLALDSVKTASNGVAYYSNGVLTFTELNMGKHIEKYAATSADPYYAFFQFLKNSKIYNATTGAIEGIQAGVFYTLLIPTNAAIQNAVNNGWLPGTGSGAVLTPTYAPAAAEDIEKVTRFLQYHILAKASIVADGKKEGAFETLLKNAAAETVSLKITNTPGSLGVTDAVSAGVSAYIVPAASNVLSSRTVIHQIDNYLKYIY
ncbi:Fasciclin domain-containing protein [Filimonas lacunae]|uniref:Fasciclin domain-containing protein n=1 Tax=Filimonas lacunae TaxID=477680 RepID=A0A173MD37_9BACT|nr:fasciclin domain-containing protein [Filimonas lacunae]BAV05426.1 hypothetical protein FLA_1433 [Filimonas lacunae]SIT21222.1 Fasciclin domain-containing protein [Filimonas lacunae]